MDTLSCFLLLNLPSVSLVSDDGFLKKLLEVESLSFLLLHVVESIPVLNTAHSLQPFLQDECTVEDEEGLFDNLGLLITKLRSLFHAPV